jgi:hypothetical protein
MSFADRGQSNFKQAPIIKAFFEAESIQKLKNEDRNKLV